MAVQEVDYNAQNYYNGDYTDLYEDAPTALTASVAVDDDDVYDDDYVTTGTLSPANQTPRTFELSKSMWNYNIEC